MTKVKMENVISPDFNNINRENVFTAVINMSPESISEAFGD